MKRRDFLKAAAAAPLARVLPAVATGAPMTATEVSMAPLAFNDRALTLEFLQEYQRQIAQLLMVPRWAMVPDPYGRGPKA